MKVHRGFPKHTTGTGRVATLGVFDGVHEGHARILSTVRRHADRLGLPAAVITFADHPHGTLAPSRRPPRLATPAQCLERFRRLGMDEVFLIRFTRRLAETPAEAFVRQVLVRSMGIRHLVVGHDFVFGREGTGDERLLRRLGRELGFGVSAVQPLRDRGRVVSSSGLRRLVAAGQVGKARAWLGWPYTLHGVVRRGEGRGGKIGMPTANLHTRHEIIPAPGIYAVLAKLKRAEYPALGYIGRKPTFHEHGGLAIEIYIPDWKGGSLYGSRLEVAFLERIRGDRKFSGPQALLRQVARDWQQARRFWPKGMVVPDRIL